MKLPSHVNEAKAHLEKTNDNRLKIMRTLTESENLAYEEYYEEMWKSLFKAEKRHGGASDNQWALLFLNAVIIAMEQKPYWSMNGEKRGLLLEGIKTHSEELKKLYQGLGLDQPFLLYDPESFYLSDEDSKPVTEIDLLPSVGIVDVLKFYEDFANEEINNFVQDGKIVERYQSNRFIRSLGQRNISRYGQPFLSVLVKAAFAIYGEIYSESDVLTLIKGRKK